ncbi:MULTISPECIES: ABC transporter permease [unclassified Streptomyces]|uniref:ABC transporter permease n=1 Tax=unclassified Streptomyces TaxID=2593676 RepID=UPI0022570222|nr:MULTISPECIES: ABC transporter permease [unclassified Streptomyces]WSU23161.1 ABC transporter permease [Streptomyces sp. NBC_01108]MCX4787845.1 ABC transporter permease [Streptomyces sp. NBC_01221]MCX4796393.1 ABC transporter permease [Streptomyces sp. NBC_01242]WSJ37630.1 ABC transporter permease [Streptomyces sp. NBC_01321]WSP64028.1 ABC transporter permease [Streptomyces sp. NBC_01240]
MASAPLGVPLTGRPRHPLREGCRQPQWLLLAVVALTVALGAAATGQCPSPAECHEDTVKLCLTGVWLGQAAVAVLAVLAMSSEYGTGTIRVTLAAVPGRVRVLAAKATVVTGAVVAAGTLAVLGSLLAGRLLLPGNGFGTAALSLTEPPTLRAAAGSVLYLGLIALLSLGTATAVRDTAGAITAVLGLLYAFPVVALMVADETWRERLQELAPSSAGLAVQATRNLDILPIAPWPGLGVLTAWAGAALLAGVAVFRLRDA